MVYQINVDDYFSKVNKKYRHQYYNKLQVVVENKYQHKTLSDDAEAGDFKCSSYNNAQVMPGSEGRGMI